MMSSYQCIVICAMIVGALATSNNCPREYSNISKQHTMCMKDVGTNVKMSRKEKDAVLAEHNKIRARVSPKAAYMMKLTYDEDLAKVAAKWAAQCVFEHDKERSLPNMAGTSVGQNLAMGYSDMISAFKGWESEIKDFHYGKQPTGVVGHYTQIVNAETSRVGCGQAVCNDQTKFHVCNYAIQQYGSATSKPYQPGKKGCDDCPQKCDSTGKLCDCRGKVCLNGGNLDIKTCKCQCSRIYQGDQCQIVNCLPDESDCPFFEKKYGKKEACIFSNVPPKCPHMCGICK